MLAHFGRACDQVRRALGSRKIASVLLRRAQRLADHAVQRFQRKRTAREVLAQHAVDPGLLAAAGGRGALAEGLDHVVIEHDRDAGLARRRNDRTALRGCNRMRHASY